MYFVVLVGLITYHKAWIGSSVRDEGSFSFVLQVGGSVQLCLVAVSCGHSSY